MPARLPPRPRRAARAVLTVVLAGLFALPASGDAAGIVSFGIDIGTSGVPQADGYNRNVRIHNQTGWTMTGLQASSDGAWGRELLRTGPLSSGNSVVVGMDDGSGACRYAVRAAFDNGQTLQRTGINACEVADYYFTR